MNVEIDALMLRRLKQLCHPDRHADNDMSVLVMKWLNTLATPAPVTATRSRQDFFYQSSASVHEHAEALRRAQHRSAQAQQSASNYNNSYSASTAAAQDEMVRQMQENMRRMQENMMREAAEKDTKL